MADANESRRGFMQRGAIITDGAALAPNAFTKTFATHDQHKLGVALVGLGGLSTNQIAPHCSRLRTAGWQAL